MQNLANEFTELLSKTFMAIITSLSHNWIPLSLAILTAVILSVYVNTEKLKQILVRKTNVSILASVAVGAFTPFCACGTMAVVIGMLTTTLPWGPVMAFLTSSPLMSPDGFILIAGVIGFKFAVALTIASVVIGLGSGYLTHLIEKKTGFLKNQTRFAEKANSEVCACTPRTEKTCDCKEINISNSGCTSQCNLKSIEQSQGNFLSFIKWRAIASGIVDIGFKQILPNFVLFVAIGYLVNYFIPVSWIMTLFSASNILGVPLAAIIGLPLYVTGESAIPLVKALMDGGASGGAMLAFLITGPATSAWVIAGISAFMKSRMISLYLFYILFGGVLLGYLYDIVLAMGI